MKIDRGFLGIAALVLPVFLSGVASGRPVARGGGTTMVEGGTGEEGGFIPVLTTLTFHAERTGNVVVGGFECLARAPERATGTGSAQFTVNAMYVTGQIHGASLNGDRNRDDYWVGRWHRCAVHIRGSKGRAGSDGSSYHQGFP
jgi:hypothetical protein